MEKPRFDQGRDFGQLYPPMDGASFHQDEHYYSGSAEYLYSIGSNGMRYVVGAKAPAAAPAPQPPAPKVPRIEQQAAKAKAPESPQGVGENLNLDGWVRGTAKIPWFSVKKEIGIVYPDIDNSTAAKAKSGLKAKGIGV